jgi:hypothetical protein
VVQRPQKNGRLSWEEDDLVKTGWVVIGWCAAVFWPGKGKKESAGFLSWRKREVAGLVRGDGDGDGLLWVLRFVAMGEGMRCWLEKEKKMGETVWRELLFGGAAVVKVGKISGGLKGK